MQIRKTFSKHKGQSAYKIELPSAYWRVQFASQHQQIAEQKGKACTFSQHQSAFELHSVADGIKRDAHLPFDMLSYLQKVPVTVQDKSITPDKCSYNRVDFYYLTIIQDTSRRAQFNVPISTKLPLFELLVCATLDDIHIISWHQTETKIIPINIIGIFFFNSATA